MQGNILGSGSKMGILLMAFGLINSAMGATLTIPGTGAFDPNLGTLISVEVLIEPPAATLAAGGSHFHTMNPQSHSALRELGGTYGNGTTIDFLPFAVSASSSHTATVGAVSFTASFGTVTLPSVTSSSDGGHSHIIDFAPVIVSGGVYDLPSTLVQAGGVHTHSLTYSPFTQAYGGDDLEPFISGNPIAMIDPPQNFITAFPSHSHSFLSGFYAASINGGAVENIFIAATTSSSTSGGTHIFDMAPFEVTSTTFIYEPVPEPGTASLILLGYIVLVRCRKRRS